MSFLNERGSEMEQSAGFNHVCTKACTVPHIWGETEEGYQARVRIHDELAARARTPAVGDAAQQARELVMRVKGLEFKSSLNREDHKLIDAIIAALQAAHEAGVKAERERRTGATDDN